MSSLLRNSTLETVFHPFPNEPTLNPSVLATTTNQPKRKFLGRTSRGHHSRGYAGPGQSKLWKKKHFGADIHDPKARTSTTLRDFQKLRSERLWAEFSFPSVLATENRQKWHPFFFQRIAKRAGGKGPRQKTSKIVEKCQKVFRHFSTIFAQGKKRQESSKSVKIFSTLFDHFRAAHH